jgi:iron complex outermembrane receptor protein
LPVNGTKVRPEVRVIDDEAIRRALATLLAAGALGQTGAHASETDPLLNPTVDPLLDPVVVTGSRLPPAAKQTSQDVRIYERERIEKSGQPSVADFLGTLPEVSLASPDNTTAFTTVRLRGAIFGSPLVLINGRRTEPVSGGAAPFGFFDLNTIPLSLVERIEILPTGSSAIYGGDALAGVVNIILRSDFTGAEGGVGYRWAKGTEESSVWAGGGWKGESSSFTIMATASHRTSLRGSEREITNDPDLRRFGGPNLGNQFFGVPANVSSTSGNLPGLNSSFAAVPRGSSGVGLTPADFAATAGTQNTGSFTRYQSMVPETDRSGAFLGGKLRVTSDLELFAELLVTKYTNNFASAPPPLQFASVPASNPFNPFGTTVNVSGVVQGAENLPVLTIDGQFVRPLIGVRGQLDAWQWEVTALDSKDMGSQVVTGQTNAAALNAALASSDPATALNPFRDGPMASPSVLASIFSTNSITTFSADSKILDAFARGPLLRLPAGPLTAVAGAEYEASSFNRGFDASRTARALFTELRAPLYSVDDAHGGRREVFAVQGAARYDDYSDFGSKTTGQLGLELRPVERLLLRGTYATAFKPPTLFQIASPITSSTAAVNDPKNGGASVLIQSNQGGNPNLQPTTSASSTLGFVWSPERVRGLDISMTRWWSRIEDAISLPICCQFIVDNESSFPGRVIRDSSGKIVAIDGTFVNFGVMRESGIDVAVDWRIRTSYGTFRPALAGTYITQFDGSSVAGVPSINRLSRASGDGVFAPRWKSIASLGWTPGPAWNTWLAGRYIGSYTDYTPPRQIGDVWYLDAGFDVAVEPALNLTKGSLGGMALSVSGTNLTDKLPDWSTFFRGYDVFNYDLVGRAIFVRLKFQI